MPVSWQVALDLAADALSYTRDQYGYDAVYGSSYGWASAGRFHHAQSQVHRFLEEYGGYVDSVNTYSSAAAEVIINHVLGIPFLQLVREAPQPCRGGLNMLRPWCYLAVPPSKTLRLMLAV